MLRLSQTDHRLGISKRPAYNCGMSDGRPCALPDERAVAGTPRGLPVNREMFRPELARSAQPRRGTVPTHLCLADREACLD